MSVLRIAALVALVAAASASRDLLQHRPVTRRLSKNIVKETKIIGPVILPEVPGGTSI